MAVIYAAALRTARMQAVADAIDIQIPPGNLLIGSAGMGTTLATLVLADPCGTVVGDVLTFDFTPAISDVSADNTGIAASAVITDGSFNVIVSGLTVGLAGTNVILDSLFITAGQKVTFVAGTLTHNTSGV